MSLESEARKQVEAQRRAAQEQERQRLAQQQAREISNQALNREMERVKSEAISKFRSLNPERLLEEVRRTWHAGRIVRFTDPLYKEIGVSSDLGGVMLYQRGSTKHSSRSVKAHEGSAFRGFDVDMSIYDSNPAYTEDTDVSPIDIAGIILTSAYGIILVDKSGYDKFEKRSTKTGFFSTKKTETTWHGLSHISYSPGIFNIDSVTPHDIHAFFVETTAARMAGAGNIKIR